MDPRDLAIRSRAGELFRVCESNIVEMRSLLRTVHAAMDRLAEQYRQELYGHRLVLYVKTRTDNKDTKALYWAAWNGSPKELYTMTGAKKARWKTHLAGGLKKCRIFKLSEASRKPRLWDFDRRAELLNEAHRQLTSALQSARKRWEDRGVRRNWEGQDLDWEAPALSHELDPRSEAAMGGAWRFLTRMVVAGKRLETLCTSYQAAPIYKLLALKFLADSDHPHGRARWLWKGNPLVRHKSSGIQDRLTDALMRWLGIKSDERRLLTAVERERRTLLRALQYYSGVFGAFLKRSRDALLVAQGKLALAEGRSQEVA